MQGGPALPRRDTRARSLREGRSPSQGTAKQGLDSELPVCLSHQPSWLLSISSRLKQYYVHNGKMFVFKKEILGDGSVGKGFAQETLWPELSVLESCQKPDVLESVMPALPGRGGRWSQENHPEAPGTAGWSLQCKQGVRQDRPQKPQTVRGGRALDAIHANEYNLKGSWFKKCFMYYHLISYTN